MSESPPVERASVAEHEWLTVREVAARFGVEPATIRRWLAHDALRMRAHKLTGTWRIWAGDVDDILAEIENRDVPPAWRGEVTNADGTGAPSPQYGSGR